MVLKKSSKNNESKKQTLSGNLQTNITYLKFQRQNDFQSSYKNIYQCVGARNLWDF